MHAEHLDDTAATPNVTQTGLARRHRAHYFTIITGSRLRCAPERRAIRYRPDATPRNTYRHLLILPRAHTQPVQLNYPTHHIEQVMIVAARAGSSRPAVESMRCPKWRPTG